MSEAVSSAPTATSTDVSTPSSENTDKSIQPNDSSVDKSIQPAKKKFKYKADGAEIEEELDDNEIASRLSLAKAANKRMQEAANVNKQVENFIKQLKEDPIKVLSNENLMGSKKFREIAENFLIQQLEEESMSPEQKAMRERDTKLAQYEQQEKERQQAIEQEKQSKLEQHWAQEYEKTIMTALQSSNLPKNEFTVRRMAELMQKNLDMGLDLDANMLSQLVKEDYMSEQKALIGGATAEQLISMFGEDIANKIRKYDLGRIQQKNPVPKKIEQPTSEVAPKRMSQREYTEYLRNKFSK